jgi:hypothetical protein
LTQLSRRHGGVFPRSRVEAVVANDNGALAPAHGTWDMPAWGAIFGGLDASSARARVRIGNLVGYIETIQAK